ncbi:protein FAM47A-like [Grammomys surdaster]|uniref:protein FAM47A-like n=2 Tax=Grammomys surdaster TaxID=491861 RepID=UPI0010A040B2|nr:protein FAM47A-like [Grammomys surdaster]
MDYANQPTYDESSDKVNSHIPSKLKYFRGLTEEKGVKFTKQIPKLEMEVQTPHDLSMSTKEEFKYGPSYQKLKQLKTQAVKEPLNGPKDLLDIEGKRVCKPDTLENLYGAIAFKDFIVQKGYNMPGILQKFFMKKGWNYDSVSTPIPSVLKKYETILQKMDDDDYENDGKELD